MTGQQIIEQFEELNAEFAKDISGSWSDAWQEAEADKAGGKIIAAAVAQALLPDILKQLADFHAGRRKKHPLWPAESQQYENRPGSAEEENKAGKKKFRARCDANLFADTITYLRHEHPSPIPSSFADVKARGDGAQATLYVEAAHAGTVEQIPLSSEEIKERFALRHKQGRTDAAWACRMLTNIVREALASRQQTLPDLSGWWTGKQAADKLKAEGIIEVDRATIFKAADNKRNPVKHALRQGKKVVEPESVRAWGRQLAAKREEDHREATNDKHPPRAPHREYWRCKYPACPSKGSPFAARPETCPNCGRDDFEPVIRRTP